MAGAKLIVHDEEVRAALRKLQALDRQAMLAEIGSYVVSATKARFRKSEAPDGSKWQPLSYVTKLARIGGRKAFKKRGGLTSRAQRTLGNMLPLIDRGHLMGSITYNVSGDSVAIGTNRKYGAIHQFGDMAGRGRKVKIPARPFLGLSRTDRIEVDHIMRSYVQGVMPR
ncbi:MAG: phage virion morphogenesis protein [Gammaproteobacteria bacterium]|nr:phage virion morphogenesis protein [Gammaproteobacteria bacterium]